MFKNFIARLDHLAKKKINNEWFEREHYILGGEVENRNFQWNVSDAFQKIFIETRVLPNNKEELLEYLIFFSSKIRPNAKTIYVKYWNSIWLSKCKYIYAKARLCLKADISTLKIMEKMILGTEVK